MIETREMTCIVCPVGCKMSIDIEEGAVISVIGNSCKRGKTYAQEETTAPKRVLTTTVYAEINGKKQIVPVKTAGAIPKPLLMEAMDVINTYTIHEPLKVGDVLIEDILHTGVNVVLTGNVQG